MSEEKKIAITTGPDGEEPSNAADREHVVEFKTPYRFEGKEYTEVDLGGLTGLTVKDAIDVQRRLFGGEEIAATLLTETTTAFARAIAVKASGRPVEFFKLMPRRESRQVMNHVRGYILGTKKGTEDHVMQLEQPYTFEDKNGESVKTYTEVDLGGIADLTCMHESAAENRMAREGFMVTDTSFNYLYACALASMATDLPEEFFTGLPVCETVKLKNAVNDAGFFE